MPCQDPPGPAAEELAAGEVSSASRVAAVGSALEDWAAECLLLPLLLLMPAPGPTAPTPFPPLPFLRLLGEVGEVRRRGGGGTAGWAIPSGEFPPMDLLCPRPELPPRGPEWGEVAGERAEEAIADPAFPPSIDSLPLEAARRDGGNGCCCCCCCVSRTPLRRRSRPGWDRLGRSAERRRGGAGGEVAAGEAGKVTAARPQCEPPSDLPCEGGEGARPADGRVPLAGAAAAAVAAEAETEPASSPLRPPSRRAHPPATDSSFPLPLPFSSSRLGCPLPLPSLSLSFTLR